MLQWSRGFSATESSCPTVYCAPTYGFNGAAAFRPRKGGSTTRRRGASYTRQWGRGFSAAERASTGSTSHTDTGFNGAAAFRPRKGGYGSLCIDIAARLQWSRGFSTAESQFAIIILTKFIHASMEPRLFGRRKDGVVCLSTHPLVASMGPRFFGRGKPRMRKVSLVA